LPRGRLRETPAGLRRAQAVVLTRAESPDQVRKTRQWLRGFWGNGPVLACRHRLEGLEEISGRPLAERETRGAAVVAFCGLARPRRFAESLAGLGLEVRRLKPFADHHAFTAAELEDLWRLAGRVGASALACSEKDQVRLPEALPPGARIWVTRLGLEFQGGVVELDRLLAWGLAGWRAA
jgi:tetraacyldisaccharide 4'-kinase